MLVNEAGTDQGLIRGFFLSYFQFSFFKKSFPVMMIKKNGFRNFKYASAARNVSQKVISWPLNEVHRQT